MDSFAISTPQNGVLAALARADWETEERNFQPTWMPLGEVLYEPSRPASHIFFPTTAVVSISSVMADGRANALTLVGHEGYAGIEAILGGDSTQCRAVILSAGWGLQIKRELLDQACLRHGSMRRQLLRYAQSYIAQVAQTTACNRHHAVDQQVSRWLLMFLDRYGSNELPLTHECVGDMMGVRRESVSQAARALRAAGCIRNQRGRIFVVDRMGLEARSCECYQIVKPEADRPPQMSHGGRIAITRADAECKRSRPKGHRGVNERDARQFLRPLSGVLS